MSTISWVEGIPSGTSTVGSFPPNIRSVWTALSTGLATNLLWPGTGGSSEASKGLLQYGASRAYFDVASNSSSAVTATSIGRAFLASAVTRLFVYGSNGTYLVGTPFLVEYLSQPGINKAWVRQSGQTFVSSTGTPSSCTVSFVSTFDIAPISVSLTPSEKSIIAEVGATLSNTGFSSRFSFTGPGTQSSFTLTWIAIAPMVAPL